MCTCHLENRECSGLPEQPIGRTFAFRCTSPGGVAHRTPGTRPGPAERYPDSATPATARRNCLPELRISCPAACDGPAREEYSDCEADALRPDEATHHPACCSRGNKKVATP